MYGGFRRLTRATRIHSLRHPLSPSSKSGHAASRNIRAGGRRRRWHEASAVRPWLWLIWIVALAGLYMLVGMSRGVGARSFAGVAFVVSGSLAGAATIFSSKQPAGIKWPFATLYLLNAIRVFL